LQYFCGIQLQAGEVIRDKDLPGVWRNYIGKHLDIKKWQKALAAKWKPYMQQTQTSLQDATCYESRIAFPTDVKLIWQSCSEVHKMIQTILKQKRQRSSRANHAQRKKEYLCDQKSKKKVRKVEKKLRKRLLKYLARLIQYYHELCDRYKIVLSHSKSNPPPQKELRLTA
jgi:hypothetical protein